MRGGTSFALQHLARLPRVVAPEIAGLAVVKLAHEREEALQRQPLTERGEHGAAPRVVEGAGPIDAHQ
eukprot:2552144-Alexandrium_andersonii.AAC.1